MTSLEKEKREILDRLAKIADTMQRLIREDAILRDRLDDVIREIVFGTDRTSSEQSRKNSDASSE